MMKELQRIDGLTQREKDICTFILEHPEKITGMSARELGHATFTSAASVVRLCQKFGCKGYPEFKLRFASEVKLLEPTDMQEAVRIAEKENVVTIVRKVTEIQKKAMQETRKELLFEDMMLVAKWIFDADSVDFYAYDTNIYAAQYGSSQLLHAGKRANTYIASNMQMLNAMISDKNRVAIIISHTGENAKLVDIAKVLRKKLTKVVVITTDPKTTLAGLGSIHFIAAVGGKNIEEFWTAMFFTSTKYILDIIFGIEFSMCFASSIRLNADYEKKGKEHLWGLLKEQ